MSELDLTRVRILANLIRDARLQAGRSVDDCANKLGIPREDFEKTERGEQVLSLPQLESLAMYLKVPMSYFWSGQSTKGKQSPVDFEGFIDLRQRIIGAQLRQLRLQAKRSVQELAQELNVPPSRIEAYEVGVEPVPLFELERLGNYLGASLDFFSGDPTGPLARHEEEQRMLRRFNELPPDVKAFIVEPINISYIETAMRLSSLDVNRLRSIAEGILDITF